MMIRYWDSLNGGGYEAPGEDFPIKPHHSPSSKILPFILLHFCILYTCFTLETVSLPFILLHISIASKMLTFVFCSHVLYFENSIAHPLENENSRTHCCSPSKNLLFEMLTNQCAQGKNGLYLWNDSTEKSYDLIWMITYSRSIVWSPNLHIPHEVFDWNSKS